MNTDENSEKGIPLYYNNRMHQPNINLKVDHHAGCKWFLYGHTHHEECHFPDSKVHGANMGPTWVLSSPGGPHVGPMNLAIWVAKPEAHLLMILSL